LFFKIENKINPDKEEAQMKSRLKLTVLGAGRCVGGSCLMFDDGEKKVVCDIGKNVNQEFKGCDAKTLYPKGINYKKIDLVILTHVHNDHSGGICHAVKLGLSCYIVCPTITTELCGVSFVDDYNIQLKNNNVAYFSPGSIRRAISLMKDRVSGNCGNFSYRLIPAGHIPGAVCVYLKNQGRTILYTGDISSMDTILMKGHGQLPQADILILDCTYGNKVLRPREESEKELKDIIMRTIKRGGSALIGAFAIERTQDVMIVLKKLRDETNLNFRVFLDGMAKEITDILIRNQDLLRDSELLEANDQTERVRDKIARYYIKKIKRAVFIASSGMLTGGSAISYLNHLIHDRRNSIILPGYQAEGTPGRQLVDTKTVSRYGKDIPVNCEVYNPSLSKHADFEGLKKIIATVQPKLLIAQHGEEEAVDNVVAYAKQQGILAIAPENGEVIYL
jgi:Cft2 family RNA processing exonuclease